MYIKQLVEKPSKEYRALVKAVRDLAKTEGEDAALRACAEGMIPYKHASFMKRHKVEPREGGHVCEERLKGKKRCPETASNLIHLGEQLPAADHLSEWKRDGKTAAITSQPYGVSYRSLKEMVAYCERNGLEADIEAGSWWFPGSTVLIVYTKAE